MSTPDARTLSLRPATKRRAAKVRTGCVTCKLRRIKRVLNGALKFPVTNTHGRCDETKPACLRCRASGRECGGYPLIKTLTFEICSDADEKRSFFYYRDQTLKHLGSFQEQRFWDRLVVQASYAHEAVRRMVVALGAFNEAVDLNEDEASRKLHTMALEQYSRALEQTMTKIGSIPPEHILIAAIMFSFFEYIRGYPMAALRHLYSAISFLLQQQGSTSQVSVTEDELRPILASTHIRASSLYSQVMQMPLTIEAELPTTFSNMKIAHLHYFRTAQKISIRLDRAYRQSSVGHPDSTLGPKFLAELDAWREKFVESLNSRQLLCNCPGAEAQSHFELGSLYLQAQYLLTVLRLQAAMAGSDATFDDQTDAVTHIVDLCERMMRLMEGPGFSGRTAALCLGFTPALVPTLAVLGLRCRDPELRRRIIRFIRSASQAGAQECIDLAADVIQSIMDLEESASPAEVVRTASDIPAEARVSIASTTNFRYNSANLRFELLAGDYGRPDLVRIRCLRPHLEQATLEQNRSSLPIGFETLYLDRRPAASRTETPYPEDVQPLFPQLLTTDTNLFSRSGSSEDIMMARRASLCQIFVPPVPPPRRREDEVPRRAFFVSSVGLGLMGAGELAVPRGR